MIRFPILFALAVTCCASVPLTVPRIDREPADPIHLQPSPAGFKYGNTVDFGEVSAEPMEAALTRFTAIADAGEKTLTLRIDSFGGSIFLGARTIRAMEDLKKRNGMHVDCIVDGAAYSMGAVTLESPLCDVRLATSRSTVLFHNGSSGVMGTADDLRQAADFLDALNTAMASLVSQRLGLTLKAYRAKIAHANWTMAAPDALAAHAIDGTANPDDIAPPAQESDR